MGTRGLVKFYEDGDILVTIYHQYDSYPSGVGLELGEFIASGKLVNGLTMNNSSKVFNGMGDMAAQYIAKHKIGPGGLYIQRPDADDCGQDYTYEVFGCFDRIHPLTIKCTSYNQVEYDGPLEGFIEFCTKDE
jgi:hypothetical protein